jgi:ribose-phosphate pyrophosphokinase
MDTDFPLIFALASTRALGESVCQVLGLPLSLHEEREFEDGEHKSRPLVNVRGRDVFVIQSLYGDQHRSVNDKLCRLLFFLGALRDASASRITAVVPYLCYSRKDRKTKSRDPVTTRYVARMFEAVGVDCVVTMDVHNLAAFQNAFNIRTDHLEAMKLFVENFSLSARDTDVTIVSPDIGGMKRVRAFRDALSRVVNKEIPTAFLEKQRSAGVVSGEGFFGDVHNRVALIYDDLISSGGTISRAARACRERGATKVIAAATHGVFAGAAESTLSEPLLERIIVTNTIPPFRLSPGFVDRSLTVLNVSNLIADAVHRIHSGGSLVEMMDV